jgi:hypothetical protein
MAYKFKDASRVKLRDGIDPTFYQGMAKVGNEGWITQHRVDRNGLPEAYVQWDRNHWADNKQPDTWTFEEHFDLVKEPSMADQSTPDPQDFMAFLASQFQQFQAQQGGDHTGPAPVLEVPDEGHNKQVLRSQKIVEDSESFMTVSVSRQGNDATPQGELVVSIAHSSTTPEAEALMGAQVAEMAAKLHFEAALLNIQTFTTLDE